MEKLQIEISDSDIKAAEDILDIKFNDEQKKVIKYLETKDIQACPGSGKTTTLVAKLFILANKLLSNNEKAICVLTHTNVAIDQISTKLGKLGFRLLNYPNHCGTVQSFVDKFLAIPAYVHIFKNRPYRIDDEIYGEKVEKSFNSIPFKTRIWLQNKFKEECVEKLKVIKLDLINSSLVKNVYSSDFYVDKKTNTYKDIFSFKLSIMQEGFLSYEDAYQLAFKYLDDFPKIKNLFNERFDCVFIDEMQDMDTYQIDLIEKLFNPQDIIIQKIGDRNQAIYNLTCIHEDCLWNPDSDLTINHSLRFSSEIAKCIKNVCISPQDDLGGNPKIPCLRPRIIKFKDDSIEDVIPRFGAIIFNCNLHKLEKCTFKAVGWVKKPHSDMHRIPNYWPKFEQEKRYSKIDFDTLRGYLNKPFFKKELKIFAEYYRNSMILSLVKSLRIIEVKNPVNEKYFTKTSLLKYLKEFSPKEYEYLNLKLAQWCYRLNKNQDIYDEIRKYILDEFIQIFRTSQNENLIEFLESSEKSKYPEEAVGTNLNVCKLNSNGHEIEILVDTIHNVKGETHTATLYLETFCYGYDICSILKYLKNERDDNLKKRQKQRLKMAYVAVTRPSHLLCLAIHASNLEGHEIDLAKNGWEIIEV